MFTANACAVSSGVSVWARAFSVGVCVRVCVRACVCARACAEVIEVSDTILHSLISKLLAITTLFPMIQTLSPHLLYKPTSGHKSWAFLIRNQLAHFGFNPNLTQPVKAEVLTSLHDQHIQSLQSKAAPKGQPRACLCSMQS